MAKSALSAVGVVTFPTKSR
ncbi:unnamed protein product, partial [Rotaria sordida]